VCFCLPAGDFGDNWYVLDNGSVEVYKKMADGNDQKVGAP
jgi:CRP-like cAMP-binding protein